MAKKAAKAEAELQTGATCVQVWLITGYNYDYHDIRCGGSPILGPYMWVLEPYVDEFIAEMRKRYSHCVRTIEERDRKFVQMDKLPTLEEQIEQFEAYLKQPHAFPAIGDED